MKKLILSAFALSLGLSSFAQSESIGDFMGLEQEVLPELQGHQKFTPKDFHQVKSDWNVKETQVEVDKEPLKQQKFSLIPWSERDPEAWLSIDQWLIERKVKDQTTDWKMRLRDLRHHELVGKILQCKGKCLIYRGTTPVAGEYRSRLVEGDEIKTEKNSVAWVYLMDGTMVRLSSETSLTLQEINISKAEVFYLARLNSGHVFWSTRSQLDYKLDTDPETDSVSLPLMIREANQEFYERKVFASQSDQEYLAGFLSLNDQAIKAQTEKANQLRAENASIGLPPSKVLMVTPNSTFIATQSSFDPFYQNGGEANFKFRKAELGSVEFHQRGYMNEPSVNVEADTWYKVASNGRSIGVDSEPSSDTLIPELITKRIKTIELARELWINQITKPIFATLGDPKKLATEFGYNPWGEDQNKRTEFLVEYTRRTETTHLKSVENLVARLEEKGQAVQKTASPAIYQVSLNHYLLGLKTRYTSRKLQVREMNDLQYYVWILKNGKL